MVKSSPNSDWITTMGDESYVKPVWCGRDYIAKVRGREGGRVERRKGALVLSRLANYSDFPQIQL